MTSYTKKQYKAHRELIKGSALRHDIAEAAEHIPLHSGVRPSLSTYVVSLAYLLNRYILINHS